MVEWGKLIVALLTLIATTGVAIWRWTREREVEREKERNKLAALYVNPFLLACEELQSRLYNILKKGGLDVLKERYKNGNEGYAEETLYLIAQYFGWQRCVYRYGPYTRDRQVVKLIEAIRATFATDKPERETGPFCFFRSEQKVLGEIALKKSADKSGPEFETIPLYEFKQQLDSPPLADMQSVKQASEDLQQAKSAEELKGRFRLVEVQNHLVNILSYIEEREGFTLFPKQGGRDTAERNKEWVVWAREEGWYKDKKT